MPLSRPQPVRVKLTWKTPGGTTEVVHATKKPLNLRASKAPITILGMKPGHGKEIGIHSGWVLKAINDVDISSKEFYEVDHMFHDELSKLPDADAGTKSQKSFWQEDQDAPEIDITKSRAAGMSLTRPEPARVGLTWETLEGAKTVYATKKPLGLFFHKDEMPIKLTRQSEGHAKDIGIRIGWVLKAINEVDISDKTFYEVNHLFHDEIGKLPHA